MAGVAASLDGVEMGISSVRISWVVSPSLGTVIHNRRLSDFVSDVCFVVVGWKWRLVGLDSEFEALTFMDGNGFRTGQRSEGCLAMYLLLWVDV